MNDIIEVLLRKILGEIKSANERFETEKTEHAEATQRYDPSDWGGQIVRVPMDEGTRAKMEEAPQWHLAEGFKLGTRPFPDRAAAKLEQDVVSLFHWLSKHVSSELERLGRDIRAMDRTRSQEPHTKANCEPVIARALAASDRIATAQARFQQSLERRLGAGLLQTLRREDDAHMPQAPAQTLSDPDHSADQNNGRDESAPLPENEDA
jgi:hypothetical protein